MQQSSHGQSGSGGPSSTSPNAHIPNRLEAGTAEGQAQAQAQGQGRGCLTCRARKIRCDAARPSCSLCLQGGFECLWTSSGAEYESTSVPSTVTTGADPQLYDRKRGKLACIPCRSRKIKCAGPISDDTDSPCPRCQRLSLACSWSRRKRPNPRNSEDDEEDDSGVETKRPVLEFESTRESHFQADSLNEGMGGRKPTFLISSDPQTSRQSLSQITDSSIPSVMETLMASKSDLYQLVRTYFATVHYYGYLTFVHEPSFFRLLDAGKAPKMLLAMMIANSLRFAGNAEKATLRKADEIYDSAFPIIKSSIYEGYGAIELMTVVLARRYDHARGNFSASWILLGDAVRIMQFLSLHMFDETYPAPRTLPLNPLLKPEALRRLAWSIFVEDTMGDAGRHGVHTLTEEGFHIQLPSDETAFIRGLDISTGMLHTSQPPKSVISPSISTDSPSNEGTTRLGLSAHIIKSAAFRRRILHFNSRIKYMQDSSSSLLDQISEYENELRALIAELPQELAYTEENLYIHAERRTAFLVLHSIRHNCFLMIGLARLNVCTRDSSLHELALKVMADRVRHALPVSRMVGDALRLGTNCDPFVAVQAYTCLEILLFDPMRLAKTDPSIDPKAPHFLHALKTLLELIRKFGPFDATQRHLRAEACRRIIRCGLGEILLQSDWEAVRSDSTVTGEDDQEFDFKVFRWHRYEIPARTRQAAKAPWAAEALLDLSTNLGSAAASRNPTPPADAMDASAVISASSNPASSGFSSFNFAQNTFDPSNPLANLGVSFSPLGQTQGQIQPFDLSPGTTANLMDQRRWAALDYGQAQIPQTFGDSGQSYQVPNLGDDFGRFLEQAGYAAVDDSDPFSWLSRLE